MDQPTATTPAVAPAQPQDAGPPLEAAAAPTPPSFGSRGRVRRRARFLRKARELAYRDLGGLVFSLHRFGQRNDELVLAKLSTLSRIDAELRALESSLAERQPVTVLREAGITACPRCAAIHSGEDRFCPSCGLPLARNVDLPIGAAPAPASPASTPMPAGGTPAPVTAAAGESPPSATPGAPARALGAPASPVASPPPAAAPTSPPAPAQPGRLGETPQAPAGEPATQTHATAAAPGTGGRSPAPPAPLGASGQRGEEDQQTEIIRPSAAGS